MATETWRNVENAEWENMNFGFVLCWLLILYAYFGCLVNLFCMHMIQAQLLFSVSNLQYIKLENQILSEFLFLEFTEDPGLQPLNFVLFLCMHLITTRRNLLIVLAILSDPTPAHAHLLLPCQPIHCGHLFHLHHHSEDAGKHLDAESSHQLCRLHHTDALSYILHRIRSFTPDHDGL